MSIERHPNFHAVQFVTDIMASFREAATRAKTRVEVTEEMKGLIIHFVTELELLIDEQVERKGDG